MQNRSIIFTAPCVAELVSGEISAPGPGEVQVKLVFSTISSGTERANLIGDPNVGWDVGPQVNFPRRSGYSSAGTVTAVGEGTTDLKPGDRVAMSWSLHSQYINMRRSCVYKLPDGVSFRDAALLHIGIFPLAAIRECRLEQGEFAIVMGMGILGLTAVQLLMAAGTAPVIAVDPMPEKVRSFNRCSGFDGVTAEDYGMAVLEYKNGVSLAMCNATQLGGYARRELVVTGSKKTVSLCPLEMHDEAGGQFTTWAEYSDTAWGDRAPAGIAPRKIAMTV